MAKTNHCKIANQLKISVTNHLTDNGEHILTKHEDSSLLLTHWLDYLRNAQKTGTADELLEGFHASLIETAGCLALGLVRPAVFALRAQVDIIAAWLYFKDHPVEWQHVETTGTKYRLVSEVLTYIGTYYPSFKDRLKLIRSKRTSGDINPYSLLSAHVHGQNTSTLPPLVETNELIQSKGRCEECISMQNELSEYLSDILASIFTSQWADLPESCTENIGNRLSPSMLKDYCKP